MDIPTIYTQNVGVLFSVVVSFFVAVFGLVKTIKVFKELHK